MKSRLIFSLSVALIFLSAAVFTYSQEKPNTTSRDTKQTQEKQVTKTSRPHQDKAVSTKTAKEKTVHNKTDKRSAKVKTQKVNKKQTKKAENATELRHHKKMEKKLQKKENNNITQKK